jgi:hypothetical protein
MSRLTKRQKTIISDVVSRWAHTINGTEPETVERVQAILDPVYLREKITRQVKVKKKSKNDTRWRGWRNVTKRLSAPKIHVVHSPIAFRIAAGVLRGQLSKTRAKEICRAFGITDTFVNDLKRDTLFRTRQDPHWYRNCSALTQAWDETMRNPIRGAVAALFDEDEEGGTQNEALARRARARRIRRLGRDADSQQEKYRGVFAELFGDRVPASHNKEARDLENHNLWQVTRQRGGSRLGESTENLWLGNFWQNEDGNKASRELLDIPHSSGARSAMHVRLEIAGLDDSWTTTAIDAEVLCAGLQFGAHAQTWRNDLMHAASVVMTFHTQALVLLGRPTLHRNRDGELHNDEGPAVLYADGTKQYYLDGHALGALGEKIVEKPETLTLADINSERNEEVKRLAIEAYGWSRYLEAVGAVVLDRRQNDVDNTVEALVRIAENVPSSRWDSFDRRMIEANTTIYKHKLVLACRSTARQYFLSVPDFIQTCAAGQQWLHAGAATDVVDVLNHPVRLIGAS